MTFADELLFDTLMTQRPVDHFSLQSMPFPEFSNSFKSFESKLRIFGENFSLTFQLAPLFASSAQESTLEASLYTERY